MGLQIIIAWTVDEIVAVKDRGRDLGRSPEITMGKVGRSVAWLYNGTDEDVEKARAYADDMRGDHPDAKVYTYSQAVKDARKVAEKAIVEV